MRYLALILLPLAAMPRAVEAAALAEVRQSSIVVSILDVETVQADPIEPLGLLFDVGTQSTWKRVEKGNASTDAGIFLHGNGSPPPPGMLLGVTPPFGGVSASIFAAADRDGYALSELLVEALISLRNEGPYDISRLLLLVQFSAFNPGGSFVPGGTEIGARVSAAGQEFARYPSQISGMFPEVADEHGCDTRNYNPFDSFIYFTPPPAVSCGVLSPDSSDIVSWHGPLLTGESLDLSYTLSLEAEASSVPEPEAWLLLGTASFLPLLRGRKRARRPWPGSDAVVMAQPR